MKNSVNIIAACLAIHVVLLITKTGIYFSEIEDIGELIRPAARIAVFLGCIWGLLRREKWAWWLSVILAGIYGSLGLAGLVLLVLSGHLAEIPLLYVTYLLILAATLLIGVIMLLLTVTRSAFARITDAST